MILTVKNHNEIVKNFINNDFKSKYYIVPINLENLIIDINYKLVREFIPENIIEFYNTNVVENIIIESILDSLNDEMLLEDNIEIMKKLTFKINEKFYKSFIDLEFQGMNLLKILNYYRNYIRNLILKDLPNTKGPIVFLDYTNFNNVVKNIDIVVKVFTRR